MCADISLQLLRRCKLSLHRILCFVLTQQNCHFVMGMKERERGGGGGGWGMERSCVQGGEGGGSEVMVERDSEGDEPN